MRGNRINLYFLKLGDLNQVESLINAGANVNYADSVGDTPLHIAAQSGIFKND